MIPTLVPLLFFLAVVSCQSRSTGLGSLINAGIAGTPSTSASTLAVTSGPSRNQTSTRTTTLQTTIYKHKTNQTTGSGAAYASACSSSWVSYSSASLAFISAHETIYPSPTVLTLSNVTTWGAGTAPTPYATCDGIPRVNGTWKLTSTWTSVNPHPSTTISVLVTKTLANFSQPTPTCAISASDCKGLIKQWYDGGNGPLYPWNESPSYYGQEMRNGILEYWRDEQDTPITWPHCNQTEIEELGANCEGCWLEGGSARLFYWPVDAETIGSPDCPDSYRQITAAPASNTPATTVFTMKDSEYNTTKTYTFTSPTAYLSVNQIVGWDACDDFWGSPMLDVILPIAPEDLRSGILSFDGINGNSAAMTSVASVIAKGGNSDAFLGTGWQNAGGYQDPFALLTKTQVIPFNYADLGRPPPAVSYYFGAAGEQCIEDYFYKGWDAGGLPGGFPCDTIIDGFYTPLIQLGSAAQKLQSAWESCTLAFGWDPPYALTAQSVAAAPVPASPTSAKAQPTVVPASPVGVPPASGPINTNVPAPAPVTSPKGESQSPTPAPASVQPQPTQNPGGNSLDPQSSGSDPGALQPQPSSQPADPDPNAGGIVSSILGGGSDSGSSPAPDPAPAPAPASSQNPGGGVASVIGGGGPQSSPNSAQPSGNAPAPDNSPGPANSPAAGNNPAPGNSPAPAQTPGSNQNPGGGIASIINGGDPQASSADGGPVPNSNPAPASPSLGSSGASSGDPSGGTSGGSSSGDSGSSGGAQDGGSQTGPSSGNPGLPADQSGSSSQGSSAGSSVDPGSNDGSSDGSNGASTGGSSEGSDSASSGNSDNDSPGESSGSASEDPNTGSNPGSFRGSNNDPSAESSQGAGSPPASQAIVTVGSNTLTANAASPSLDLGSTTLLAGDEGVTLSNGQSVSVGNDGIVVGSSTIAFSAGPTPVGSANAISKAIVTIGSQAYTANAGSIVIGSQVLTAGGSAATISGQVISAGSSGVVVGGNTVAYSAVPATSASADGATFTIGSSAVTASESNGAIIVGPETLSAGGPGAVINGQSVSAGSSGLIIGGTSTFLLSQGSSVESGSIGAEATLVAGSQTFTASAAPGQSNAVVIDGHTLSAGGSGAVINGQSISMDPSDLIIGGSSTVPLTRGPPSGTGSISSVVVEATFVAGSQKLTASEVSSNPKIVVIDGHTLSVGGSAATIDGHTVSDAPSGIVVDGTTTAAFFTSTPTTEGPSKGHSITNAASATSTAAAAAGVSPVQVAGVGVLGLMGWLAANVV